MIIVNEIYGKRIRDQCKVYNEIVDGYIKLDDYMSAIGFLNDMHEVITNDYEDEIKMEDAKCLKRVGEIYQYQREFEISYYWLKEARKTVRGLSSKFVNKRKPKEVKELKQQLEKLIIRY